MAGVTVSGGNKWQAAIAKIAGQKAALRVGILEGATYSGEGNTPAGTPVATVAVIQEFGAAGIPARPFMRNTVLAKKAEWARDAAKLLKGHPDGAAAAFTIMGDVMAKDIQQTIENGVAPSSSQQTIARKVKRGKQNAALPLVDTGTMQESISFEVVS